jgi:DNA-binding response OmpR family regulator
VAVPRQRKSDEASHATLRIHNQGGKESIFATQYALADKPCRHTNRHQQENVMSRILILEDESTIANEMANYLRAKGLECDVAFDGEMFLKYYERSAYDIYLLDINVPKINGLDICATIRERDTETPIIMLTAFGEIEDKKQAFGNGADDYMVKPFLLEELFIRIQALLRRRTVPGTPHTVLTVGDLILDIDAKTVHRAGVEITLTPKEYKLLTILAQASGRVLSKQQIADSLWDYHVETNENTIEVYINFLRNKIDRPFSSKLIHTKIGFGYYLKEQA